MVKKMTKLKFCFFMIKIPSVEECDDYLKNPIKKRFYTEKRESMIQQQQQQQQQGRMLGITCIL